MLKMDYFLPSFRSIDFCAVWGENISFFTFFLSCSSFPNSLFSFSLLPSPAKTPLYLQERERGRRAAAIEREREEERGGKQFPFTGENKLLRKCGKGGGGKGEKLTTNFLQQISSKKQIYFFPSMPPSPRRRQEKKVRRHNKNQVDKFFIFSRTKKIKSHREFPRRLLVRGRCLVPHLGV